MSSKEKNVKEDALEVLKHSNVDVSDIKDPKLAERVSRFLSEFIIFSDSEHFEMFHPCPDDVEFQYNPILKFEVSVLPISGDLYVHVLNWGSSIGLVHFPRETDFDTVSFPDFLQQIKDIFRKQKEEDEKYAQDMERRKIIDDSRKAKV